MSNFIRAQQEAAVRRVLEAQKARKQKELEACLARWVAWEKGVQK